MKLTVVLPALLSALRLVLGPVHDTRLITEGQLVFSTEAFTSSHWVRLISERVGVAGNLECDRSAEPPFPCKTQVVFSSERLPSLEIAGDAYSFASADLNLDGREELLVLSAEHGNWRLVNVFALSLDGTYWYRPFDAFLWYPGFEEEVCDASIYWIEASHQIKIVTTNADDETFACSAEMIVDWERKQERGQLLGMQEKRRADGSHERIVLKPKSQYPSFNKIVLEENALADFKVIGIFERELQQV